MSRGKIYYLLVRISLYTTQNTHNTHTYIYIKFIPKDIFCLLFFLSLLLFFIETFVVVPFFSLSLLFAFRVNRSCFSAFKKLLHFTKWMTFRWQVRFLRCIKKNKIEKKSARRGLIVPVAIEINKIPMFFWARLLFSFSFGFSSLFHSFIGLPNTDTAALLLLAAVVGLKIHKKSYIKTGRKKEWKRMKV